MPLNENFRGSSDWEATRASIQSLALLEPSLIAPGHGTPLMAGDVALQLKVFAAELTLPTRGRYVQAPAVLTADGIRSLPPAPPDRFALNALRAGAVGLAGLAALWALTRRSRSPAIHTAVKYPAH